MSASYYVVRLLGSLNFSLIFGYAFVTVSVPYSVVCFAFLTSFTPSVRFFARIYVCWNDFCVSLMFSLYCPTSLVSSFNVGNCFFIYSYCVAIVFVSVSTVLVILVSVVILAAIYSLANFSVGLKFSSTALISVIALVVDSFSGLKVCFDFFTLVVVSNGVVFGLSDTLYTDTVQPFGSYTIRHSSHNTWNVVEGPF